MNSNNKPGISVLSGPDDTEFQWASRGWYRIKDRGKPEAEALFAKAKAAIAAGEDYDAVIENLKAAGFEVVEGVPEFNGYQE